MADPRGWIGVDLDGTLAYYDEWRGPEHIGEPIPEMVERVKAWLAEGIDVRVFTARISGARDFDPEAIKALLAIRDWCVEHLGRYLPVTNEKDYGMLELYDDRCVQVEQNTGRLIGMSTRAEVTP